MENENRNRQEKSYTLMRMIYDITMALLFLSMSVVMFFGQKWGIEQIIQMGRPFALLFGSMCLLYGGFRLYRGIKKDY